jgi:hypothetical protein
MSGEGKPVLLLGCGIFKREFALLPEFLRNGFHPVFLDSMLHMEPARLDLILTNALERAGDDPVVLAFGDCSPHLPEFDSHARTARVEGCNCCEIWLGRQRYRELRREAAFFLMPEWTLRWERIIKDELGLKTKELAKDFMAQTLRRAVYIDTGVIPVPTEALEAFSVYTGLPITVDKVGPGHFTAALETALRRIEENFSLRGTPVMVSP